MSYIYSMEREETSHIHVNSLEDLHNWLVNNSETAAYPVWIVIYKKNSGKQKLSYEQVLEEAICFGLIDTQTKTVDSQNYAICLRQRKIRSNWTSGNIQIAKKMILENRMTEAGERVFKGS